MALTTPAQAKKWAKNVVQYAIDDRDPKTIDTIVALRAEAAEWMAENQDALAAFKEAAEAKGYVCNNPADVKGLAKVLERVPRPDDAHILGMYRDVVALLKEGGGYGNGQRVATTLAAYDTTVTPDGLTRSAVLADLSVPFVVGQVDPNMTDERSATDIGIVLNFGRRQITPAQAKESLKETVKLYAAGKLPKHWTLPYIAREYNVSEQTPRNYFNALKRPATAAAEQVVTTTQALERTSRVPLPTPIPSNPDVASRLVGEVKAWPATYPIPEAVRIHNHAVAMAALAPAVRTFLEKHDVTFDDYGMAVLPSDKAAQEEEVEEEVAA